MALAIVTGAAGFIGSTLVKWLLADPQWDVIGIDAFTDYYDPATKRSNLEGVHSDRFELLEADLTGMDLDVVRGAAVVFHLAGQPGVRGSWGAQFHTYLEQNVLATQRLLEAVVGSEKLRAFVYSSSSSVYGDALRYPTRETDLPAPKSPYGVSKLAAEHLCSLYAANHGVPTRSLRFFTVYGPRQRPDMAFHRFIRAGLAGEPVTVYGDGRQVREFTYVDDIVRAVIRAAGDGVPAGSVINLSGGSSVSVLEVIAELERILERRLRVEHRAAALGDVLRTGGSTDRARDLLGWTPAVPLAIGLARQVEWMRSNA